MNELKRFFRELRHGSGGEVTPASRNNLTHTYQDAGKLEKAIDLLWCMCH